MGISTMRLMIVPLTGTMGRTGSLAACFLALDLGSMGRMVFMGMWTTGMTLGMGIMGRFRVVELSSSITSRRMRLATGMETLDRLRMRAAANMLCLGSMAAAVMPAAVGPGNPHPPTLSPKVSMQRG